MKSHLNTSLPLIASSQHPTNIIPNFNSKMINRRSASNSYQQFISISQLIFAVPVPQYLRSLIGVCQYLITVDYMEADQHKLRPMSVYKCMLQSKNKYLKDISQQFLNSMKRMLVSERLYYFDFISQYILELTTKTTSQSTTSTNNMNMNEELKLKQNIKLKGYVKLGSNLKWNYKTIAYDKTTHTLWITDQPTPNKQQAFIYDQVDRPISANNNQNKPYQKTPFIINLCQYLIRISKNTSYKAFVLEAWDKRINNKYRSISIGLSKDQSQMFEQLRRSVSFSVEHKIREFVKGLYMKDPVYRGAVCSISGSKMCQDYNGDSSVRNQSGKKSQKQSQRILSQMKMTDNKTVRANYQHQQKQQQAQVKITQTIHKNEKTQATYIQKETRNSLVDIIYNNAIRHYSSNSINKQNTTMNIPKNKHNQNQSKIGNKGYDKQNIPYNQ